MSDVSNIGQVPMIQRVISTFWPSFLTAGAATVVLFTWIDPARVAPCLGETEPVSLLAAYSVGFFILWLLTAVASALTCYFSRPTAH